MSIEITADDVLLLVDIESCFCPDEANELPVPDGDAVVDPANAMIELFKKIAASVDWHGEDHCSFIPQGGPFPIHGVAGTPGSEFHSRLNSKKIQLIIRKGYEKDKEQFSCVDAGVMNLAHGIINKPGRIFVCGLATDYCVKATALELQKVFSEFGDDESVFVVLDACRGVAPETTASAIEAMKAEYIQFCNSTDLVAAV